MVENIFAPLGDWGLLILRLSLAIVMVVHGWPKLNPNGPMKGPAGLAGFLKQIRVHIDGPGAGAAVPWRGQHRARSGRGAIGAGV